MNKQIPVIIIFAPTACGKTALVTKYFGQGSLWHFKKPASFSLYKISGEVISADSQAVYREFNIGTAKADPVTLKELPHHLIDIADPDCQFGVADFVNRADILAQEIFSRKHIPLLVGGSGFYIRNFLLGLSKAPESNLEIREKIKERIKTEGNKKLYFELKSIDSDYAEKIDIHDQYRICRALEVYYSSGKKLSSYTVSNELRKNYDFCTIILNRPRQELYKRIDSRLEEMFSSGLVDEIKGLLEKGYDASMPAFKAIGYSEFFDPESHDFKLSRNKGLSEADIQKIEEIKNQIKHHSHRYAKRQYTFMKDIPGALVIDADDEENFCKIIFSFLEKHKDDF